MAFPIRLISGRSEESVPRAAQKAGPLRALWLCGDRCCSPDTTGIRDRRRVSYKARHRVSGRKTLCARRSLGLPGEDEQHQGCRSEAAFLCIRNGFFSIGLAVYAVLLGTLFSIKQEAITPKIWPASRYDFSRHISAHSESRPLGYLTGTRASLIEPPFLRTAGISPT